MRQMEGTMSKRPETKEKNKLEKFKKMLAEARLQRVFFRHDRAGYFVPAF